MARLKKTSTAKLVKELCSRSDVLGHFKFPTKFGLVISTPYDGLKDFPSNSTVIVVKDLSNPDQK